MYLTHNIYRYIGKFPAQIAHKLIEENSKEGDTVLDAMVGGGTTLLEAQLLNRGAIGFDINPVPLLVTKYVTLKSGRENFYTKSIEALEEIEKSYSKSKTIPKKFLVECAKYFDDERTNQLYHISNSVSEIEDENIKGVLELSLLGVLRKCSFANVKKMNLELDLKKKTVHEIFPTWRKNLEKINKAIQELQDSYPDRKPVKLIKHNAIDKFPIKKKVDLVVLHPPYLTNTAFSESTQLQLAYWGLSHKTVWKEELKCRGSFLHETNGLRKYLVNWNKIIINSAEVLKKKGRVAIVVGDGQIDYARIPVGKITEEFLKDNGFKIIKSAVHLLNNQTGHTQNKKMKVQHIIVGEKL